MARPEAWTYRVALNLASSHRRRKKAEKRAERRHGPPEAEHTDPDAGNQIVVRDAIRALPERQRAAVVLRYFVGLSVRETSEALDCAEGTTRALTSQAIAALRSRLAEAT